MRIIRLIIILLSLFLLFGCATITEKVYLQQVEVAGPINHPPIHITGGKEKSSITVSPKIFINTTASVSGQVNHTYVNGQGIYQLDTIQNGDGTWRYRESPANRSKYRGRNLNWKLPNLYAGLDLDISLSKSISFAASVNYSNNDQTGLMGGSVGLGFYKENEQGAIRFDAGINIQEYAYDASTVVVTTTDPFWGSPTTEITFFHDINKNSDVNFYASLTYNSIFENSPVNFFVSLSYFGQSLLDFEPSETNVDYYPFGVIKYTTDARGEVSSSYLSVSPGIYQNLSPWSRIVLGVSIIKNIGLEQPSQSVFILPQIKFDLMF
ncbi:MAG TPA: hypothetical protein VMT35_06610 [Ignavibacteriaceae bacterium]|nr:hypothetical protein [Ignavibacteriaceae bacterium]